MTHPIATALIGYGFAGRIFHAPFITADPGLTLTAVVSSRKAEITAAYPETAVFTAVDTMLSEADVDLVVIATPNDSHFPLAKQALLAGKHVIIDKPFTITTAAADELIALAEENGRLLSVYHNRRWDNDFRTIHKLVTNGALGQLHTYQSHYDRYRPEVRNRWRERDEPGAGLLYDLGAHLIDQALYLMGTPDSIWADIGIQRDGAQADDYFHLVLHFSGHSDTTTQSSVAPCRAILHGSSLVTQPPFRFALHGSKASFFKHGIDPQEADLLADKRPQPDMPWGVEPEKLQGALVTPTIRTRIPSQPGDYRLFYAGIVDAIRNDSPPPVTAVAARNVIAIIEAAHESGRSGQTIPLNGRLR